MKSLKQNEEMVALDQPEHNDNLRELATYVMKQLKQKHFEFIINTMFKFANIKDTPTFESLKLDKDWYLRYSWSQEQQNDFQKWLEDYIALIQNQTKRRSSYIASFFILMYGFPTTKTSTITDGD